MNSPQAKRLKQDTTMPTIGTHSGTFHADEAMACFLLHQTEQFANASIVRTRDMALLDTLDIAVDVGAVYDAARHRYDHHQRGFAETFDDAHQTKLSSAGLIYKHFGREIIKKLSVGSPSESDLELIYQRVYDSQFQRAMAMAGEEFVACVTYLTGAWLPARVLVAKCLKERFTVDPSGRIGVMESGCPWKDHLFSLEEEEGLTSENNLLYVLFPDGLGN
eukprot:Ihof_evm5s187 gene=Ihof_evmTU5s187